MARRTRRMSVRLVFILMGIAAGLLAAGGLANASASDPPASAEGGARVLPPRKALSVEENPTDDEVRAAFDEAAACIRGAGLSVPVATVTIGSDGIVRGTMQVGLGESGLDIDSAAAVREGCRDYYEALLVARGRAIDKKEGRGR